MKPASAERSEHTPGQPHGAKSVRLVSKAIERGLHLTENGRLVLQTGKEAVLNRDRANYTAVQLSVDGERGTISLARIICHLLNGPPPTLSHVVDHIDRDKKNDSPGNLRWATYSENLRNNGYSARGTSATAERVMACLSACEGISTDALTELQGPNLARDYSRMESERGRLRAEVERLRSACKACLLRDDIADDELGDELRAALGSAK